MKKILCVTVLFFMSVIVVSCKAPQKEARRIVYAMGTIMELKAYGQNAETALDEAEKEILRLDNVLSRGKEGSDVERINSLGTYEVSRDTADIIRMSLELNSLTGGAFDITVAPVSDLWGFYTHSYRVPSEYEILQELNQVGSGNILIDGERVTLNNGAQIDLGGVAKGYLSGKVMEIFRECGVESGIVSLGGNVDTIGTKTDGTPWRIGIQHPDGGVVGTVSVCGKAVITSGGYQRFFEKDGQIYHHIIDPHTGYPAESGIRSVTVIGDNSALADGLSTAFFVMGLDKSIEFLKNAKDFDAVILTDEGDIYITEGIQDVFQSDFDFRKITRV